MSAARTPCRTFLLAMMLSTLTVATALAADATALQRARDLMESGRLKPARALLEAEVAARPADAGALAALAEVLAGYGELAEAEKVARRAVAAAPNDSRAHTALAEALGRQAARAGALKAMKVAGQFRKEAETAARLDPKNVDARQMLMQFHLQAPGIAGGDRKKARALAEEIGRIDAARGELAMAEVAQAAKDSNAVEPALRRAVAKDPRNAGARLGLANWLAAPHRQRWDDAAEQTRAALAIDPDRPGGYALLAIVAVRRADMTGLDAVLAESATHVPENRGAWYQAGRTLLADGRELPRAEKYFRHYLADEAAPGSPTHAHARWRLANVLEKQGRKGEAVAELETALRLKPDLDEAKKDLKRLKK